MCMRERLHVRRARVCALAGACAHGAAYVHPRVGARECGFAGAGSRTCGCTCVRARVCMHYYYIVICASVVCVHPCVSVGLRVCTYVRSNVYSYVCGVASAYACARM